MFDTTPYEIGPAFLHWLSAIAILAVVVMGLTFLFSLIAQGKKGPGNVLKSLADMASEWTQLSCRRIWAIGHLTLKEAIRRKALYVFAVFVALFMFGGWFLSDSGDRPDLQAKAYISFVLTSISWLILPVILLLSCWGLPEDIKARSLHTVVTKPVRRNEVVLGRIVGFAAVGTILLTAMGTIGYVWILRQVPAGAQSELISRVPVYGSLSFIDREGRDAQKGINVGDVWDYRSYIEGATKARAIWTFKNIDPNSLGDALTLEARFEAFRTHKGDIEKSLLVQYTFINPTTNIQAKHRPFVVEEYSQNVDVIDREFRTFDEEKDANVTYDLFNDFIDNGSLTVEVQCLDAGQYLGMSQADLFVRKPNRPFASGYFKSIFGTWLQMVLVVALGVTASCFLKGPVGSLLTFTFLIIGQGFREFMERLVGGEIQGSGTLESIYRIIMHMNPQTELDAGPATSLIQAIDLFMNKFLLLTKYIIPDFSLYATGKYVANGFDVSWNMALLPSLMMTLAYLIPCILLGYISLKIRELETK